MLRRAVGSDWKGKASLVGYALGVVSSLMAPALAQVIDGLIAVVWLIPDRRIERLLHQD
ncbi:MAG: hypothetical protein ACKO22_13120 [Cyanobium sp.]